MEQLKTSSSRFTSTNHVLVLNPHFSQSSAN